MTAVKKTYERRVKGYSKLLQRQKKAESLISSLRLIVFTVGAAAAVFLFISRDYILYMPILAVCLFLFAYFVVKHDRVLDKMKLTTVLQELNHASLKRLNGQWNTFEDTGREFIDDNHSYSGDLDIFGMSSLFQCISTANTFTGRQMLKELLSGVVGSYENIRERQEAVKELAGKLKWRQRFSAEGMLAAERLQDPQELLKWGLESDAFYSNPWVIAGIRICPIITLMLSLAGFVIHLIPWVVPATALLLQFAMISFKVRDRYKMFTMFEQYNDDLRVYYKLLKLLEKQSFQSELLKGIKSEIRSREGLEAYRQANKLAAITDSLSNRRNMYYVIFNAIALWDFQKLIDLERWKRESGRFLRDWFDALGKLEALASLAVLAFENPEWTTPSICEGREAMLAAKSMGHPLLVGNRVPNDVILDEKTKVLLITGSNMSGKSTLLRTAGINLVLAYAGAPVCASSFSATLMELHTCMRIRDNIEQSISSFYGELLRIKSIVRDAEDGKTVFFLLDEIFKGTNSLDRHTGARVLINKLSGTLSGGMVSTHDLELCELEQKNPKLANYHFQEYYEDGKLHFDYKLQSGPSTTRNALHLMRLAGIEVEESMM